MAQVPKRVQDRLQKQIGSFQKILEDARGRDVNESDTVTIVTDMLAGVFGYDKYSDITSEQAIRGTYCDLAVKLNNKIQYIIEVKAIGLSLKENHLRQAVNYGANQGVPWVVLTNGIQWEAHRILFEKPISHELVFSLNFLELSARKKADYELLYLLAKEAQAKEAIKEFHERTQSVNRFVIGSIIQTDLVVAVIRRELKRLAPDAGVSLDEVCELLPEVLKRDVIEGEHAEAARKQVQRGAKKALRQTSKPGSRKRTEPADSDPPTSSD